jgi:hypothetical protein
MRVRCKATADYRSNAVGSLELETSPSGLLVSYRGVGSYQRGYAPGTLTHGTQLCVPWNQVHAVRIGSEHLLLNIDAKLTPLNRFYLGEFSRGDPPLGSELVLRRRIGAIAMVAALGLMFIAVAKLLPAAVPHIGAITLLGIAVSAAVLILLMGAAADRWLHGNHAEPGRVLAEFSYELGRYLPQHIASEPLSMAEPALPSLEELQARLPRSAIGVAITLSAASLAALLIGVGVNPTPIGSEPGVVDVAEAARVPALPSATPTVARPIEQRPALAPRPRESSAPQLALGEACECERPDSLLWPRAIPTLSPIVVGRRDTPHQGHQHIDLDLAAINNGDRSLEKLNVAVVFYEQGGSGRKRKTVERPLYFEGPLGPGRAIKWQVEGRGTSFEILAPDLGVLSPDGNGAANNDAFVALTKAHHQLVRWHAATLLAYLGDARAHAAALSLRQTSPESEAAYLDRVLGATRPLGACQISTRAEGPLTRWSGCLYNDAGEAQGGLRLEVRALDHGLDPSDPLAPAPVVLAAQSYRVEGALAKQQGRRVEAAADFSTETARATVFELIVEREETSP